MPGDLVASFGNGGKVTTDFAAGDNGGRAVVVAPDGGILVAGFERHAQNTDMAVTRYHPEGSPDTVFGDGGHVRVDFVGESDEAAAVLLDHVGRIVVGGFSRNGPAGNMDFALARFTADGRLDPTFGDGGRVTTDFGGADDIVAGLALENDGDIVAAGCARCMTGQVDVALARYHPDGHLDESFGGGGLVRTDVDHQADEATAVAIAPDGGIVIAGYTASLIPETGPFGRQTDFLVARYASSGVIDLAFGTDGLAVNDFDEGNDAANALVMAPDGTIVAGGLAYVNDTLDFALVRYQPDGQPDTTFGDGGQVTTDFGGGPGYALGEGIAGLVLQPDGAIVAAGVNQGAHAFALARYTTAGLLDPTFGDAGRVLTGFGLEAAATSVALSPGDDDIVVAGTTRTVVDQDDIALARYNAYARLSG